MFRSLVLSALLLVGCAAKKPTVREESKRAPYHLVDNGVEGRGSTLKFEESAPTAPVNTFTALATWIGFLWLSSRNGNVHYGPVVITKQ